VCAPIASTGAPGLAPWLVQGIAINRFFPKEKPRDKTRFVKAVDIGVLGTADSFPEELTHAPATWMLPGAVQDCFGPLDATAAQRFVEMAVVSGARFGRPAPADPLDGLLVSPSQTELVALTDSGNQVIALWLRTPEPVDWRRVSASLQVRHVEPASGCPTAFAKRHPLVLEVAILPSPDGASAFLGGRFSGDLIHLPRGYFELTLRFHPSILGLPPLYPTALVGPTPENVVHRFIQPLGASWPLPTGKGQFRFDYIALLRKYVEFDPHIWERGIAQGLSAEEIEQQIRATLKKDPRSER
jgi:hypothetical protein